MQFFEVAVGPGVDLFDKQLAAVDVFHCPFPPTGPSLIVQPAGLVLVREFLLAEAAVLSNQALSFVGQGL